MLQQSTGKASFEALTAFVAVAEMSNFSKAAKALGRDATVVSRRVRQLEHDLGVRLLSRTTRRVVLTEVGTIYYQRIRGLLDDLDSANLEASDYATRPQGLLRVSLPVTFGLRWVAPLLPAFIAKHPMIRVDARFSDRYVDVVAEGFDVAIRVGALRDSSLMASKIAPFRNLLVAAPSYLAAQGHPTTPDDLAGHACLGFTSHSDFPDWILKKGNERKTVRPAGALLGDSSEALLIAAISGVGIILTPDWLAGPALREGQLVRVLDGWDGPDNGGVYAIMPPGRLVPNKTRVFVDEITQSIQAGWVRGS
ncbi:LysR family transcriptional regulator [Variovorax sp. RT4R15]|uniref:LysR family transcriptional regulator n=1 Tax=Variovorax sp. RT4R15 TaxID=3443737 RepID=UPI003F493A1C